MDKPTIYDNLPLHFSSQVTQAPYGDKPNKMHTHSHSRGGQLAAPTTSFTFSPTHPAISTPIMVNITDFTIDSEVSFTPPVLRLHNSFVPVSLLPSRNLDSLLHSDICHYTPNNKTTPISGAGTSIVGPCPPTGNCLKPSGNVINNPARSSEIGMDPYWRLANSSIEQEDPTTKVANSLPPKTSVDSAIDKARSAVESAAGIEPHDISVPDITTQANNCKKNSDRVSSWDEAQVNFDSISIEEPFDFEIKARLNNERDKQVWEDVDTKFAALWE